jgi:hypothetical protein
MQDVTDFFDLVFSAVAPPPDITRLCEWTPHYDEPAELENEDRGFSRGFLGTMRTTRRGVEIQIMGSQWPDGTIEQRAIVLNCDAVGGDLTAADSVELAACISRAVEEMGELTGTAELLMTNDGENQR